LIAKLNFVFHFLISIFVLLAVAGGIASTASAQSDAEIRSSLTASPKKLTFGQLAPWNPARLRS
jgi:uncharacterized membrane protein